MEKRDGKSNKLGGGHKLQRNLVKGKDKRGEDKNKVKFDKLLFGEILLLAKLYVLYYNQSSSFIFSTSKSNYNFLQDTAQGISPQAIKYQTVKLLDITIEIFF